MITSNELILASASPRRAQLLREARLVFQSVAPRFDDSGVPLAGAPAALAARLARAKAESVAHEHPGHLILGCDTLLDIDGRIVGKPADESEARTILGSLLGREHKVVTAFCLMDTRSGRKEERVDTASVTIHHPGREELEPYIASGAWRGKAGGYNLAELQGRWRIDV